MCVSNFQVHLFTNVLKFWCYDPYLCSPGQRRFYFFPSYITFWITDAKCLWRDFFCLQLETNLSISCLEAQNIFFVIQGFLFLFFDWVKWKIFFSFVLFSSREKKRKDNYLYLWQWIIEIFIITQPYKLCAKRETKVGMVLSRKLTYFLFVL
mgnify:CR=1 FL=1